MWINSEIFSGHKTDKVQEYVLAKPRRVVTLILNIQVIKTELSYRKNSFTLFRPAIPFTRLSSSAKV